MITSTHKTNCEHTFEMFCRREINKAAIKIYNEIIRPETREVPYCEANDRFTDQTNPEVLVERDCGYVFVRGELYQVQNPLLVNAIQLLPPKNREAIVLSFFARKTDYRIARELNVCPGTVAYRKKLGVAMLRSILEA